MTVMGIHRPDTVIVFLITGQHRNQQPGIQCALNVVIRKLNNANPLEGGIKQGPATVATDVPRYPYIARLARFLEAPVIQISQQAVVVRQFGQRVGRAVRGEIIRRGTHV